MGLITASVSLDEIWDNISPPLGNIHKSYLYFHLGTDLVFCESDIQQIRMLILGIFLPRRNKLRLMLTSGAHLSGILWLTTYIFHLDRNSFRVIYKMKECHIDGNTLFTAPPPFIVVCQEYNKQTYINIKRKYNSNKLFVHFIKKTMPHISLQQIMN